MSFLAEHSVTAWSALVFAFSTHTNLLNILGRGWTPEIQNQNVGNAREIPSPSHFPCLQESQAVGGGHPFRELKEVFDTIRSPADLYRPRARIHPLGSRRPNLEEAGVVKT
jgi:hypothetical protein